MTSTRMREAIKLLESSLFIEVHKGRVHPRTGERTSTNVLVDCPEGKQFSDGLHGIVNDQAMMAEGLADYLFYPMVVERVKAALPLIDCPKNCECRD